MSYRDPKIIVDRSAEIYAQGASQLGQSMTKLVDDSYKVELAKTNTRIAQVNAIGKAAQQARDRADVELDAAATKMPPGLTANAVESIRKDIDNNIKRNTQCEINPASCSKDDRLSIRKEATAIKIGIDKWKNMGADNAADTEEVNANSSNFGSTNPNMVVRGFSGVERLNNLTNSLYRSNQKVEGITSSSKVGKDTEGNEIVEYTSILDASTSTSKEIINAYGLDVKNGFATITSKGDPGNFKSTMVEVPIDFDSAKAKELESLVRSNGTLEDIAYFPEEEYSQTTVNNGKSTLTTIKGIFNEGKYLEVADEAYKAKAAAVVARDSDQQWAFVESRLGNNIEFKDWDSKNPIEKRAFLTEIIKERDLKVRRMTMWSREGNEEDKARGIIASDGNVYYKSRPSSLRDLPKDTSKELLGGRTPKERKIILANISELINEGLVAGKEQYVYTFKGPRDVNTRKYMVETIVGDYDNLMVYQATYDGKFKDVKGVKTLISDIRKQLGSTKKAKPKGGGSIGSMVESSDEATYGQGLGVEQNTAAQSTGYFDASSGTFVTKE